MSIVTIRVSAIHLTMSVLTMPHTERRIPQQPSAIHGRLPFSRHIRVYRSPQRWFACLPPLPTHCLINSANHSSSFVDLEWKLIYVSSPGNEELDQELDDCLVGPVPVGVNSFEFEGSAPDTSKIPPEDVLGVAALILTGSYNDQEFVRVGYYQNTEYDNDEMKENPPSKVLFERLVRDISTKPRVTRFQIKW